MFSPPRHIFWASAVALSLAAAPAHAAGGSEFLTDVQGYASEAVWAIAVYVKAMAAGDMPHIRAASFVLSGIIGLIGLWLLAVKPRVPFSEFVGVVNDGDASDDARESNGEPMVAGEADRPIRLLEAIAAAKAQMSISEAEKKHAH